MKKIATENEKENIYQYLSDNKIDNIKEIIHTQICYLLLNNNDNYSFNPGFILDDNNIIKCSNNKNVSLWLKSIKDWKVLLRVIFALMD